MGSENFEQECKMIREQNEKYLKLFERYLIDSGLSKKTVKNHVDNASLYINDFLLWEDAQQMEEGVNHLDYFFSYFFIRKCLWSTPASIKSTAASIKKFYKCMMLNGFIKNEDYDYLCDEIKSGMDEWVEECEEYNDCY